MPRSNLNSASRYVESAREQAQLATVLRKVSEQEELKMLEFNKAFVLMEFFGYLRRDPDQGGNTFWLNKLNDFNGNFVNAEMVKAF